MFFIGSEIHVRRAGGPTHRAVVVNGGHNAITLHAVITKYSAPQIVPTVELRPVEGITDTYEVNEAVAGRLGLD